MRYSMKFKIADVIFGLTSRYPRIFKENREYLRRYGAFIYRGKKNAKINITVEVVDKFPPIRGQEVFAVYEPDSGYERWRLWENRDEYSYYCPIPGREVTAFIKKDFSLARTYVLPYKSNYAWDAKDIIYDLMLVMLINYFAYNQNGLILHAAAVKEDGHAIVFAGRSESGKTTTARLWHRHSKAAVLNDDRVIVRKTAKGFFAYSGPWSGEYGHAVTAVSDQAPLRGLFVIGHAKKNYYRALAPAEALRALYPTLFTGFWNRKLMDNTLGLCEELMGRSAVFRLGFVKDKKVISFVRKIIAKTNQL
jgi:hypothetical protein